MNSTHFQHISELREREREVVTAVCHLAQINTTIFYFIVFSHSHLNYQRHKNQEPGFKNQELNSINFKTEKNEKNKSNNTFNSNRSYDHGVFLLETRNKNGT